MYTNEEYCETVLLYGQCNRNKRDAARLYATKFPIRRHPSYCTITSVVQRVCQCCKLGVVIEVFPYVVPHLQRISAEDVLEFPGSS
ncbi:hypothetical protein TNCV_736901 [Trichonephila clavipes]|nr:hypothetical protein TNCV_736901 [Trichonephila clavipes]